MIILDNPTVREMEANAILVKEPAAAVVIRINRELGLMIVSVNGANLLRVEDATAGIQVVLDTTIK
jgi:hypothetical protein